MAANLPDLGGAGLVPNLYEYLWTMNNLLQSRCMFHKCPPVQIPDTVLLKNKQPSCWYFSSLKSGTLQRRSKTLNATRVTQALITQQDPTTDIVCVFVGSAPGDVQPITEYLTASGLEYFLAAPPSRRTKAGMLQSFIHPKGTSNFIIRVSWTPENCVMDSCININKLSDPDLDAQERASTNDEKNCVVIPTSGNVIATQLERLCACVAEHVHMVTFHQVLVKSMILNFKIDSSDRVWLLWCEHVELSDTEGNAITYAVPTDTAGEETAQLPRAGISKGKSSSKEPTGSTRKGPSATLEEGPENRKSAKHSNVVKGAEWGDDPLVVDSDEEDLEYRGDERQPQQSSQDEILSDEGVDDEQKVRADSATSEGHEPTDYILIPEGMRGRKNRKVPSTKTASRKVGGKLQDDSTPRSDVSSTGDMPTSPREEKRRTESMRIRSNIPKADRSENARDVAKNKNDNASLDEQNKILKRQMAEEKRKREQAEKKMLEASESLKRAEAKANALKAKFRRIETSAADNGSETSDGAPGKGEKRGKQKRPTGKDDSLPKISSNQGSRPASQSSSQAALVPLETDTLQQSIKTASASGMAEEIIRAADIDINQEAEEEDSAEEDLSALNEFKDTGKEPSDLWEDDLVGAQKMSYFTEKDVIQDKKEEDPGDEIAHVAIKIDDPVQTTISQQEAPTAKIAETQMGSPSIEESGDRQHSIGSKGATDPKPKELSDTAISSKISPREEIASTPLPVAAIGAENENVANQVLTTVENVNAPASATQGKRVLPSAQPIHTSITQDSDEYEDRPIENTSAIKADRPVQRDPPSAMAPSQSTKLVGEPDIQDKSKPAASQPVTTFTVEATVPGSRGNVAMAVASLKAETEIQDVNEFEVKGKKYEFSGDPSPASGDASTDRIVASDTTAEPLPRNWAGDEIGRDARSVNEDGSFRSELRVGTAFEKWSAVGISTVMEGTRVGSTVSVFSVGEIGVTFSSIFDDDGLQPKHMQQLMKGNVGIGTEENNRCTEERHLTKAIPDPIPDFHQPIEEARQCTMKESSLVELELPARKMKGIPEKKRDNNIESICMPMEKDLDPNEPEDIESLKAEYGLPDVLWRHEELRGTKFDVDRDPELMREANESRLIEKIGRTKGATQGQIDTSSYQGETTEEFKGFSDEAIKVLGNQAPEYLVRAREPCIDYVAKHVEWVYDEYLRQQDEVLSISQPDPVTQELSELMEMKFEVAFSSDEERMMFANAQREKLAKLLGIPVHCIDVMEVKPGSPVTLVRFQIKASDAAMIRGRENPLSDQPSDMERPDHSQAFDVPALAVSMLKTGGEDAHRQLSSRLHEVFGSSIPVDDRAVQNNIVQTTPTDVLDSRKAYTREDAPEPRKDSDVRSKGAAVEAVPGSRIEEEPHQHVIHSGEHTSVPSFASKDKGRTASVDTEEVERVYKPGREIMQDDQFSSAKIQRRAPKPAKRLKDISLALENDLEEQVKVPYEEVDNTRRLKEQEDELNFLPAQRAALAPRTAILAKKNEGLEDARYDFLVEYDQRKEEKRKEDASRQPSLKLTKSVEEVEYELAQKITGLEDPRTVIACEPAGLSTGDRRSKKKGKDGERLSIAAVPEAYMAFGLEKDSQRLAPSVVTLEKPSGEKGNALTVGKAQPELINDAGPTLMQFKFDASFVDEKSRFLFAEGQRLKLAKLLRIPEDVITVRVAVPGSPITIITFEIDPGVAKRAYDGVEPVFSSRPFDSPVIDVEVTSPQDEEAEIFMRKVKSVLGPKVSVSRQSFAPGKAGIFMKDKNVTFDNGKADAPQPAYLRTKSELEAKALLRQRGALTSDKEAVEGNVDHADEPRGGGQQNILEAGMEEKKPILSFDRRLPKNAKNKSHLLARIHTIESTLQKLYGKLEVDAELPDVESIEQIMSNTIKQAVYAQDSGVTDAATLAPAKPGKDQPVDGMHHPVNPASFEEEDGKGGQDDEEVGHTADGELDAPGDDVERRNNLRAERRKRMEERERIRTEKQGFDVKPKTGSTVRFEPSTDVASAKTFMAKESSSKSGGSLQHLKEIQNDDSLALYPANIPSVPVQEEEDDVVSNAVSKRKMAALSEVANENENRIAKAKDSKSARSDTDDGGLDSYELQQMAANGNDGWKAIFSKVRHGKRSDVLSMLDAGCPLELKDEAGNTLLNVAAQNGHKSIIKALLRRGCAINTQNHKGQTPLHFCFTYGFTDLGNYLISKGGDDTVQNFAGLTCYEGLGDG